MGIDRYVRVPAKRGAKAVEIAVEPAGEDRFVVTVDGRRFVRLPRDYVFRESDVARAQLAKAGVRLAWVLNSALR